MAEPNLELKRELLELCHAYAQSRIASARQMLDAARESAQGETKSSAGDKYETGRSMAQLEMEKAGAQLAEGEKLLQTLRQIPVREHTAVTLGSLVRAGNQFYFLSIPAGKLTLNGQNYFAISPASPAGQALAGKQVGAVVTIQQRELQIEGVW